MKNKKGMEFSNFFVLFLVVGLFIFLLVSAAVNFGNYNSAETNLNQNPVVNKMFGNVSVVLNKSSDNAESSRNALVEEEKNPVIGTLGFVFKSILTAANTFMSMGVNIVSYIFVFGQESIGISPVISGVLMAILVGLFVLAIWSLVRAGR